MEDNKKVQIEKKQQKIDSDFIDIDKDAMKKNYVIVAILYFIVIILFILLVFGIKNQKDIVKDKINNDKEINNNFNSEKKDEQEIQQKPEEEVPAPETNNKTESDDKLNILDQI